MELLDLLTKFIEVRERNRLLVLNQCLLPLKTAVDTLHESYLKKFRTYRESLRRGDLPDAVAERLGVDLTEVLGSRLNVAHHLRTLRTTALRRIGGSDKSLQAIGTAVLGYLGLSDGAEFHEIWAALSRCEMLRMVSFSNPTLDLVVTRLSDPSGDGLEPLVALIDAIMADKHKRYVTFVNAFARFRDSLLA